MKYIIFLISFNCVAQDNIQKFLLKEINEWRASPCAKMLEHHPSRRDLNVCKLPVNNKSLIYDKQLSEGCFEWAKELTESEFRHSSGKYNESIYKGYLPRCIYQLILDIPDEYNLDKDYGHRKHLLGAAIWSKTDTKIGIGWCKIRGSQYAIVIRTI